MTTDTAPGTSTAAPDRTGWRRIVAIVAGLIGAVHWRSRCRCCR